MVNRHKWLLKYIKPYYKYLGIVLVLSLASTALSLSYPYFTSLLIDDVLTNRSRSLTNVLFMTFGSMILGYLLSAGNSLLYLYVTLSMLRDLRSDLFNKIQKAQYADLIKTKVGDIITRLNGDAAEVQSGLSDIVLQALIQVCTLVFVSGMLIWLNWKLAVGCFIFFPVLIWSVQHFRPKIVNLTIKIRKLNSELQSFLIERLNAIKMIKQFSAEDRTTKDFKDQVSVLNKQSMYYSCLSTLAEGIPRLVIILTSILVFAWGGHLVLQDQLSVGTLVAFTGYQARLFGPIQSLAALYLRIHRMGVSFDRLEELFHIPSEEQPRVIHKLYYPQVGLNDILLKFNHVTYRHHAQQKLLDNVNLTLHTGQMVALIGDSGQGKSTMIDIITGFFKPSMGMIEFAGQNILDYSIDELRNQIAVSPQQPQLFHGTILDNIRFGVPDATMEKVEEAAICAEIHNEILNFPMGYQTVIGERGMALSGGQRQRVALARTLLKEADLYILDEATSEVDEFTERKIYQHLHEQLGRKTLLIISHRLAVLDWVEHIWELRNGILCKKGGLHEEEKHGKSGNYR